VVSKFGPIMAGKTTSDVPALMWAIWMVNQLTGIRGPTSANEVTRHSFSQANAMSTRYTNFQARGIKSIESGEAKRKKQNSAKARRTARDIAGFSRRVCALRRHDLVDG
jgi:hypothetical protein